MTTISKFQYVSRSGLRAEVGHPLDDPYQGNPKSGAGIAVMQDGPVGLSWTCDGKVIEKRFNSRIQAVEDRASHCIVVIGHWNTPLDGCAQPGNGIVFNPDGTSLRAVMLPPAILGKRALDGQALKPEGLSVVKTVDGEVELWLPYWQGSWHEQRIYHPESGVWGRVTGQYRAV